MGRGPKKRNGTGKRIKMENHPLYRKLRKTVLDNNYTIEQVQGLNFNQATELLGNSSISHTFLNNMKCGIVLALQERDDKNDLQQLKQTAGNWLDTNFPNWEAEVERESGKPCVRIWLKGKP
jgi:acylphosphatase